MADFEIEEVSFHLSHFTTPTEQFRAPGAANATAECREGQGQKKGEDA